MILQFKSIKLVNFGSYATTEINLTAMGFCLVSGENFCVKDNATSNGSGKSTIWSAICYALTGETISGLSTGLKNINIDSRDCSVTLELTADSDDYIITRINQPNSYLKIIKNNVDISGKGIRESNKILADNLPDITKDLIASTIIIGQGMPSKFSSFNPSGRKELLEKLTKSDFMIEDIKTRLAERQSAINSELSNYSTLLAVDSSNLARMKREIELINQSLAALSNQSYDADILTASTKISQITEDISVLASSVSTLEATIEKNNETLLQITTHQSSDLSSLSLSYNKAIADKKTASYKLEIDTKNLTAEINRLKSITDVCPTCGQKLHDILKPDTSNLEADLIDKHKKLQVLQEALVSSESKYYDYQAKIKADFVADISNLQQEINKDKQQLQQHKQNISTFNSQLAQLKEQLAKATFGKETLVNRIDELKNKKIELTSATDDLLMQITQTTSLKAQALDHLATVKKMITLTQRDFRGYLLKDIIEYLDSKAKEYCKIVFNTTDLSLQINGNSLDITYGDKMFDNLSGGEKQRCDLILQFAIRNLLQTFLNYSSNILVLDEIFDGLDKLATNKILELVTTTLTDVESIFIISHHPRELDLPIDSEIKIIKNKDGISEVI